jgi:large subunit ribosomal protein L37Ae
MARTRKIGSAGRFGTRYGLRVKSRIRKIDAVKKHSCPDCLKDAMKREATGIWSCKKCGLKMAGKAHRPI